MMLTSWSMKGYIKPKTIKNKEMKRTFYVAFGAIAIISGSILSSCNTSREAEETAENTETPIMNTDTTNSMNMDNNRGNNIDNMGTGTDSIRAVE